MGFAYSIDWLSRIIAVVFTACWVTDSSYDSNQRRVHCAKKNFQLSTERWLCVCVFSLPLWCTFIVILMHALWLFVCLFVCWLAGLLRSLNLDVFQMQMWLTPCVLLIIRPKLNRSPREEPSQNWQQFFTCSLTLALSIKQKKICMLVVAAAAAVVVTSQHISTNITQTRKTWFACDWRAFHRIHYSSAFWIWYYVLIWK